MTDQQLAELRLLQIRNAIVDKERCIANANLELARGGEWRSDWNSACLQCDLEVERVQNLLLKGE